MGSSKDAEKGQLEDLLTDLIYLRKDAGFTPRRYRQASAFLVSIGGDQPFSSARKHLLSALYALPEQRDTELLLAALALADGYDGISPLKKRREQLSAKTGLTPDTIADYETAALQELALFLLTARYARSPWPDQAPVMHDVAIHELVTVTTLVRDRVWTETREQYRTIPLIDDVAYFEVSSDIPAKITASSVRVVRSETTENGLKHRFYFGQPLQRGKAAELSFVLQPDVEQANSLQKKFLDELILREETRAFHLPTIAAEMEVLFLGEKPKTMWQYAQLPLFERPGQPTKEQLLDLAGGSSIRVRWEELNGGLYSGIAWKWK